MMEKCIGRHWKVACMDLLIHKLSASLNVSPCPGLLTRTSSGAWRISPFCRFRSTWNFDKQTIESSPNFHISSTIHISELKKPQQCECNVKFCLVHQSHPRSHSSCHWWQKLPPVLSKAWSHQAWKSPEHMVGLRVFSLSHCHEWLSRDESKVMLLWLLSLYDGDMLHCLHKPEEKIRLNSFDRGCTSSPLQRKLLAYWPCISGATPALASWYPKRQCIHRCY